MWSNMLSFENFILNFEKVVKSSNHEVSNKTLTNRREVEKL